MNLIAHIVIGFLVVYGVLQIAQAFGFIDAQQLSTLFLDPKSLALIIFASAFADIDHHRSHVFRAACATVSAISAFFVFAIIKGDITTRILFAALGGFAVILVFHVFKPRHRGITHTFAAAFVFAFFVAILLNPLMGFLACVAYISHLVADKEIKLI